jgi:anti-sigma28 factor (negative regulator of flagellin synthesis)
MNPINNVGSNNPIHKINTTPVHKEAPTTAPNKPSLADRVELSGVGHLLGTLKDSVRADKVAAVKAQIEAGTYEDDKKLDVAVDRLLDELNK